MTWVERGGLHAWIPDPPPHTGYCHDACDGRTDPIDPPEPCYCSCHYRADPPAPSLRDDLAEVIDAHCVGEVLAVVRRHVEGLPTNSFSNADGDQCSPDWLYLYDVLRLLGGSDE